MPKGVCINKSCQESNQGNIQVISEPSPFKCKRCGKPLAKLDSAQAKNVLSKKKKKPKIDRKKFVKLHKDKMEAHREELVVISKERRKDHSPDRGPEFFKRFDDDFPVLSNVPEALESSDEEYKSANSIWVPQKYAGFVAHFKEGKMKRYLGTWGMGPCIALVFYDENTQSGMVAHFDSDGAKLGNYNAKKLALKLSDSFKKIIVVSKHFKVSIVIGSGPDIQPELLFPKGSTPAVVDAINGVFKDMPCKNKACNFGCSYEKYRSITGDILLDLADGNLYKVTNLPPFIEPKAKSDLFRWITTKEEGDDQMPAYHFDRWLVERGKGNVSTLIFRLKGSLYVNKKWHHQNDTNDMI